MSAKESVPYVTRIIDPRFDRTGLRSEFRLEPDTCYYADMRLANIGFSSAAGATTYNSLLGAEVPIKSISLLDGGTVIEAINNFQAWRPIQKVNSGNDENVSMGRYLCHNDLGFSSQGRMNFSTGAAVYGEDQDVAFLNPQVATVGTTAAASKKAWISLKEVFGSLRALSLVPTNVFTELRVVIEYSTSGTLVAEADPVPTDLQTTLPVMYADELTASQIKQNAMATFQGINYLAVEHDSFALPAVAGMTDVAGNRTIAQTIDQKLKGFNGKYMRDLILKFTPTTAQLDTAGTSRRPYGQLGSQALWDSTVQVRVNGQNVLPRSGCRGSMRKLAQTTDTLGTCNILWPQATVGPTTTLSLSPLVKETIGEMALFAVDIESAIEDLQVSVTRSGVFGNADLNARVVVDCFARVPKSIVVGKGGRYTVAYAQTM